MKNILRQRQGIRREDSNLSERVKRFYQEQDDLINGYKQVEKRANNSDEEREKNDDLHTKSKRMTVILSRLSLAVNIVRTVEKIQKNNVYSSSYYFLLKSSLQYYLNHYQSRRL